MNNAHELASAYATQFVKRLGLTDEMSIARGDAEMVWDLAYDAFMWRSQPTLGIPTHEKSDKDGMYRTQPSLPALGGSLTRAAWDIAKATQIEDDAADDDGDGTLFMGGRL